MSLTTNIAERAEEIFSSHILELRQRVDRLFAGLMLGQWLFAILVAIFYSPYAWAGRTRRTKSNSSFRPGRTQAVPTARSCRGIFF